MRNKKMFFSSIKEKLNMIIVSKVNKNSTAVYSRLILSLCLDKANSVVLSFLEERNGKLTFLFLQQMN